MSLNSIEHNIIKHMAKTMFATAWADYHEQVLGKGLRGEIMDQVPETPDYILQEAYYQAGRLAEANKVSIFFLFRKALKADGRFAVEIAQDYPEIQDAFGYGMIMPMMGHGVSWFDTFIKFPCVLPDFEWSHFDLDEKTYPCPVEEQ